MKRMTGGLIGGLLVIGSMLFFGPSSASAGEVAITRCLDRSRSKIGQRTIAQLAKSLKANGAVLMGHRKYIRQAKKRKLARRALKPAGIARLSKALSLDGVVTCKARRIRKRRFEVVVSLHGPDGKVRLKRSFRNRRPRLARAVMEKLADDMAAELGVAAPGPASDDDIALVPLAPVAAAPEPGKDASGDPGLVPLVPPTPESKPGAHDAAKPAPVVAQAPAPADAASPPAVKPAPEPVATRPSPVAMLPSVRAPEEAGAAGGGAVAAAAPPKEPEARPEGVVPEVWLAAGAAMHLRAGLSPRYETALFPGVRVQARAFLGAGVDLPFLKDLGIDGAYGRGFGLSYASSIRPEKLDGTEQHWVAGLVYRLDFEDLAGDEIPTGPTVLLRGGYGFSENAVDKRYPDVLSAAYTYTYAGLGLHLWLVRSLLSAELSASYLISVWPSDSLSGDGSGIAFSAGINLELVAGLRANAGYEQIQFVFDEDSLGETSDRFQMWYLRLGWAYR